MSLVEEMIEYRARYRISQRQLAALCGLSSQTINSVENQRQTPSRITEKKIRLVIDAKEDVLYDENKCQ